MLDPASDKERRREVAFENSFLLDSEAVEKSGDRGLPPAVKLCRMSGGGGAGASSKFTIFAKQAERPSLLFKQCCSHFRSLLLCSLMKPAFVIYCGLWIENREPQN